MKQAVVNVVRVVLKTVVPIVLGFVVLIGVTAWMIGMFNDQIKPGQSAAQREQVVPTETYTVRAVEQTSFDESIGTLKAATRTEISARVQALITEIRVRAGDTVQQGDVLAVLDSQRFERQKSQAEAAVSAARANLAKAEDDHDRAVQLRAAEFQAITQQQFNQAVFELDAAKARVHEAEQALAELEIQLSYTEINAPKSGVIVDRRAEPGDLAQIGQTLFSLYDPTSLRLEVPVREHLAARLKVGDMLQVKIDSLDKEVPATVDEIVPQAVASSRSFLVKVKLPPISGLFEGMFGRLLVPAGRRQYLCLDTRAVRTVGQLQFVDVVSPDHGVERRYVKLGQQGDQSHTEVISGLAAGDVVVLRTEQPGN